MTRDWQTALHLVGFLSADQLERYFGLAIQDVLTDPDVIWHQNAVWHRHHWRRGARRTHCQLLAEAYLALAPELSSWRVPTLTAGVRPDAVVTLTDDDQDIFLEVDSGKETQRQWQEKLCAYRLADCSGRLLVAAHGQRRRLFHLHQWLVQQSPVPWALWAFGTPFAPAWHAPQDLAASPTTLPTAYARATHYRFQGQPVDAQLAEMRLQRNQWREVGREICHGYDVVYLDRRR
jgi:hypothetical protein